MSFVHLHCHSEYSLLDGANRIDDLIRRAQELEQPGLAITDHGNLHAAWEFQEKAKKAKLKPIIGMEAYVAPGDRRARGRPTPGAKPYYHLVLLARDLTGYRNLVKLSSLAYTEGFYTKPRALSIGYMTRRMHRPAVLSCGGATTWLTQEMGQSRPCLAP